MVTNSTSSAPIGIDDFENVDEAYNKLGEIWEGVGRTTKYSTGLPLMDEYLGGGFGSEKLGEVVLIHAGSKTQKSTLSMQIMKESFDKGEKMGWAIVEGGFVRSLRNLKQLYCTEGYDKFEESWKKNKENIFQMGDAFINSGFSMSDVIVWMKNLRANHDVRLFLIDPIGYLADYSSGDRESNWQKESKFMKDLVQFADNTCSTVICITHNVKDSQFKKYREEAIGGSQSFSKSPTKVIELRNEGYINDDPRQGMRMSMEMYMARDVRCWKFIPLIFEIYNHPDGKGRHFFTPVYRTQDDANSQLSKSAGDKDFRVVWDGQVRAYESL